MVPSRKKNPLNEFIFSLKLTAKIGKNVFDLAYKSKTLDLQQYTYITALVYMYMLETIYETQIL